MPGEMNHASDIISNGPISRPTHTLIRVPCWDAGPASRRARVWICEGGRELNCDRDTPSNRTSASLHGNVPTYMLVCLPTYLPTHPPTRPPSYLPTYLVQTTAQVKATRLGLAQWGNCRAWVMLRLKWLLHPVPRYPHSHATQ